MTATSTRANADYLIPRGWRWRISCHRLVDGSYELSDPKTGARLAMIVPEFKDPLPYDSVLVVEPCPSMPKSYVVVDGNMVTRWYTLDDAVLYAAQARGEWGRGWPWSRRQFWGDGLRCPWAHIPTLVFVAVFVAQWQILRPEGWVETTVAAVAALSVWVLLARFIPGQPEADYDQTDDGEVEGWPDDPRWSALFDSTVWYPGDKETTP